MSKKPWFEVDREGLAEIVKRRGGLAWLIQELISNAWDEQGVTKVDVSIEPVENSPMVELTVIDDAPNGFQDLSHAWTLFAKSAKRTNAEKRGRFNLGEKLVLAFCREAAITTTTGQVMFDSRGRTSGREKRAAGSEFFGVVRMTRAELTQALADLKRLIPPDHIATVINGQLLTPRQPIATWGESLWTELPNDETGALERRLRWTEVRVFAPYTAQGEKPMLYELGIPVVELDGDPLHIDVRQKVPLNLERDNVTPSYLRELRATVLKNTHAKLSEESLRGAWATDAMSHWSSTKESVEAVVTARFGKERATADPNDREAENKLKAKGVTIVHGGSLPADAWERVREFGVMKSAGQILPTPKPFTPGAPEIKVIPWEDLSVVVRDGVLLYRAIATELLGFDLDVVVCDEPQWPYGAVWEQGKRRMVVNLGVLGEHHFVSKRHVFELAIHEMAHEKEGNHLDEKYHDELCRLGAALALKIESIELTHDQLVREAREKVAS